MGDDESFPEDEDERLSEEEPEEELARTSSPRRFSQSWSPDAAEDDDKLR